MPEDVERSLDRDRIRRDLEQLVGRLRRLVDAPGLDVVALLVQPDHLLHLRPGDVRVDADAADAPELQEREDQVVVARVQVEPRVLDDAARLVEVVVCLLDCFDGRDLRQLHDRLGLDIDHDAAGNVVDDDRPVADIRDRLEVLDDAALRRLVVVGGDDQEAMRAGGVRRVREVDRMGGRIRTRAGDHGGAVADGAERNADELEPLVVGERRRLAGRAGDDETVRAVLDEMVRQSCETVEVDRAVRPERRDDRRQDFAEHCSECTPGATRCPSGAVEELSRYWHGPVSPVRGFRRYAHIGGKGANAPRG